MARPLAGRLVSSAIATSDRIIGVSREIADGVQARTKAPSGRVIHLANGYNDREITRHTERKPESLLFVGSLIPRKNPDILFEAFAQIADSTSLDLVVMGDGPMRTELEALAARLGIAGRVRMLGQCGHELLDAQLAKAAALVLPSSSEGMPIVVNEALASGTPVVATRLPGTIQQVSSDELGYLVPVRDVGALAEAMLAAATRKWDYARIAETCGVPSWAEYARDLMRIYTEVVSERASRQ
jgi:glycosyltransferase involved in cell wall biosynthesis